MLGNKSHALAKQRNAAAQIYRTRDSLMRASQYFFESGQICNFAISGIGQREDLLGDLLHAVCGEIPLIILYRGQTEMEAAVGSIWLGKFGTYETENNPLWAGGNSEFEPFLGMQSMDIVQTIQNLVKVSGFTYQPSFTRVIQGHLKILDHLQIPYSLSGLYFLCNFENIEEFQGNIYALDCSMNEKNAIIWDLGINNEKTMEQFDLFRMIIRQLAYEAQISGWDSSEAVGNANITMAIRNNATHLLPVDSTRSPLLMAYLCRELMLNNHRQFLLLVDDVRLADTELLPMLSDATFNVRFGLICANIVDMLGGDHDAVLRFSEKLDRIVILKHALASTANTLADMMGTIEFMQTSESYGTGKGFFSFLPDTSNKSVTHSKENRYRVMPEEIISLGPKQAILFNTRNNEILRF